jgi:hypothetical protein
MTHPLAAAASFPHQLTSSPNPDAVKPTDPTDPQTEPLQGTFGDLPQPAVDQLAVVRSCAYHLLNMINMMRDMVGTLKSHIHTYIYTCIYIYIFRVVLGNDRGGREPVSCSMVVHSFAHQLNMINTLDLWSGKLMRLILWP